MLTNVKVTIWELQRVSEEATIRDWVKIGEEDIFLVPLTSSEMRIKAEQYQIMGKAYEAHTTTSTDIEKGHKLEVGDDYYEVRSKNAFSGSANVDNILLLLEKLKE